MYYCKAGVFFFDRDWRQDVSLVSLIHEKLWVTMHRPGLFGTDTIEQESQKSIKRVSGPGPLGIRARPSGTTNG